ncbi:zinc metalloprotease HtpX [Chengkuizengella axinellae]|uniref:Zinc metalloprotease HtpX n=1 Tax=Chengkuizengella axinellae TaxID=3064388 RepID=A0ABT9J4D4_9BACL|nr:zinc metalloprotease HtpX [Chengkuizengella sp. 2205SS18-9]MDP5276456.1 zinc metalloprotease HtpX [Chengkuizengella sp. 2205SS18-9]
MYIVDFMQRLFKKGNTGIIIYLLLNTLIVITLFQDPIIGLIVYGISLVLALSPFGEWILRVQQGCKPLARKEHIDRLQPLFDEVYSKAKKLDPDLPDDIKLFISKDPTPNAFATGRKTICINKGMLEFSDEQIKATFAHEFGHLSNKDTDLILIVSVGNLIMTALFIFYRIIFTFFGSMFSVINHSLGSVLITFLIDIILVGMMWLWTKFGTVLVMHTSRSKEYEADHFAHQLGYGAGLIEVLDRFNEIDLGDTKGLWANLASSHPDPDQRIGKLQNLEDVA